MLGAFFLLLVVSPTQTLAFRGSLDIQSSKASIPKKDANDNIRSRTALRYNSVNNDHHSTDREKSFGNFGSSTHQPLRLNKVFKATHSRRQADDIIEQGRVTVNGEVSHGCMVMPFQDEVRLDGKLVTGWEAMNGIIPPQESSQKTQSNNNSSNQQQTDQSMSNLATVTSTTPLEYIKYYKPRSVICTTDTRIRGNLIDALRQQSQYNPRHRVYPVGRLDKDTSGLILVTSDGRLPNASLRSNQRKPKVYQVQVDLPLQQKHIQQLREGVVITTVAQRDQKRAQPLTAKTQPCDVEQLSSTAVQMTLREGRNRQIRKMMGALGYTVRRLHRIRFGEITMEGLEKPGDWKYLDEDEMEWIRSLVEGDDSG